MEFIETIRYPVLLIHETICRNNIRNMVAKARRNGLNFRPHFKTHQSALIGEWFRQEGVEAITVSSAGMARYFAKSGWRDITIAFPVNLRELDDINHLAGEINLNLITGSPESLTVLARNMTSDAGLFIEIDTGYHRSGINPANTAQINRMISEILNSKHLIWRGLLSHFGETYRMKGSQQIQTCYRSGVQQLLTLRDQIPGGEKALMSIGDTPSCSLMDEFTGVDEIRPGNFVYYDLMQYAIGSCDREDIAVCIAAPVVECHPERRELVIYTGSMHLSKESLTTDGKQVFGLAVRLTPQGWHFFPDGGWLTHLSQEHGLVCCTDKTLYGYRPGDLLGLLPVHSCLTVSSLKRCFTLDGLPVPVFTGQ